MDFIDCLREQLALHPAMEPRDAVKLCFQAAFGAEHLLHDLDGAKGYFDREYSSVAEGDGPLWERISPGFCRVNLASWKGEGLPPDWLFALFRLTAGEGAAAEEGVFEEHLAAAEALAARGEAPFTADAWREQLAVYRREGVGPVHHSDSYREKERPAYRVVSARFLALLPVLTAMAQRKKPHRTAVVALDGRSASGKSTLAAQLAEITGAGVVHMDDFFLPGELRTAGRLAEPGGNVHVERVLTDVIPMLSSAEPFSYRAFDCGKMALGETRQVAPSPWRIVEGAYSFHPRLGDYADLWVFCHIDPEEQMRRIQERNGREAAAAFRDRWIPLEERYIEALGIREKADLIYQTSAP